MTKQNYRTTLKRFPLTHLCVALIWFLCFCTPPRTSLDEVPLIDKWVHIAMYAGTTGMFWLEYWRMVHRLGNRWSRLRLVMTAVVAPILMSGVIELLQAYCTGGRRSGDWLDFLANSIGVGFGLLLGLTLVRGLANMIGKGKKEGRRDN